MIKLGSKSYSNNTMSYIKEIFDLCLSLNPLAVDFIFTANLVYNNLGKLAYQARNDRRLNKTSSEYIQELVESAKKRIREEMFDYDTIDKFTSFSRQIDKLKFSLDPLSEDCISKAEEAFKELDLLENKIETYGVLGRENIAQLQQIILDARNKLKADVYCHVRIRQEQEE